MHDMFGDLIPFVITVAIGCACVGGCIGAGIHWAATSYDLDVSVSVREEAEELEVLREYSKGLEAEREGLLKHAEHLRAQLANAITKSADHELQESLEREARIEAEAKLAKLEAERKR